MSYKVNVSIEKTDSGYLAYCPELSEQTFQGDSLDLIFSELKTVIQADYQHQVSSETKRKPIWEIQVIEQTHQSFLSGFSLYEQRMDKGYSLTDCISMQTMCNLEIQEVLTHDKHFTQEGFTILLQ